jgi:glucokinase
MSQREIVLGVDIGGTNTALGYVDQKGVLLAELTISTEAQRSATEFFDRLHREAENLRASIKEDTRVLGIGLGAPNGNYYKGTIEQPPNLSWRFVDVVASLQKWYAMPVVLTNDANAAALGEMLFGAAKGMKDFIVITLGTGLGSGIVANGELIYGHDGCAGEIGHTIVDPEGRHKKHAGFGQDGHRLTPIYGTLNSIYSHILGVEEMDIIDNGLPPTHNRLVAGPTPAGPTIQKIP